MNDRSTSAGYKVNRFADRPANRFKPRDFNRYNKIKENGFIFSVFEWTQTLLVPMLVVILILTFVFGHIYVNGRSMENTLYHADRLIVTKFLYEPTDGDIVVVSHGQNYDKSIIKRVIATEGQSIKIDYDKNQLFVDGVLVDEPYLHERMIYDPYRCNAEIPKKIPEGKVFVMGDNRNYSDDSRSTAIGLVNKTDIMGKAWLIYWPLNRFCLC